MYELEVDTAEEELKRADHLIFVSLKYTRTCDVMKNAIKRMIVAFELSMKEYLEHLKKEKKLERVHGTAKERALSIKNIFGNQVKKYLALYSLLKKIDKAEYTASEEFRKNVTLTTKTAKPIAVKVINLYEYLEMTKSFVSFIKQEMKGK